MVQNCDVLARTVDVTVDSRRRDVPMRYRFWKLKPLSLSQACFASITSS